MNITINRVNFAIGYGKNLFWEGNEMLDTGKIDDNYCVAYIDILGFKEMTNDPERIKKFSLILNESIDVMKNFDPQNKVFPLSNSKSKIISIQGADSMFFIFPKDFISTFHIFQRLGTMQLKLALKGIYIRGSINSGTMYIDEVNNIFFGEAWNKAVASEASAVTPRIILENNIAKLIEDELRKMNESVGEFYLDDDGTYVVSSYGIIPLLKLMQNQNPEELYKDLFEKLEYNVEQNSEKRAVLQKYLWIANQIEHQQYGNIKKRAGEIAKRIINLLINI